MVCFDIIYLSLTKVEIPVFVFLVFYLIQKQSTVFSALLGAFNHFIYFIFMDLILVLFPDVEEILEL